MHHLELDFRKCKGLIDISSIGHGIKEMKNMHHLELDFRECKGLIDISSIGHGIKEMMRINVFKVNFDDCTGLLDSSLHKNWDDPDALSAAIFGQQPSSHQQQLATPSPDQMQHLAQQAQASVYPPQQPQQIAPKGKPGYLLTTWPHWTVSLVLPKLCKDLGCPLTGFKQKPRAFLVAWRGYFWVREDSFLRSSLA